MTRGPVPRGGPRHAGDPRLPGPRLPGSAFHRLLLGAIALAAITAAALTLASERKEHRTLAAAGTGPNVYPTAAPGETAPLPRMYPGAPPRIPHDVEGLIITRTENPCLECHLTGEEVSEGHAATKVPPSHFTDPRTGKTESTVAGARWKCVLCHVRQAAETPPVGIR